ncbi:MAG: alpha/beta fold hydrolase [Pontiellaceae bacterium]|nr:alpha/beta fold hydrolase [Pontiellaceae bacterium]
MKSLLYIGLIIGLFLSGCKAPSAPPKNETVVLLHGLARSSKAMNKMERTLRHEGYDVINIDYPSTTAPIEELSDQIFTALEPQIHASQIVHFVTHSMGGTLLQYYLQEHELKNLGRVVMLAPPSQGSEVPDKLGDKTFYQWFNGPAGNQLGTGKNSLPLRLEPPAFELGIIAGDRTINPILSMLIPGPDDGKVAVARTKPECYTDYLKLHVTHACMMWNHKVIDQTKNFLETGQFQHPENSTSPRPGNQLGAAEKGHPLRLTRTAFEADLTCFSPR